MVGIRVASDAAHATTGTARAGDESTLVQPQFAGPLWRKPSPKLSNAFDDVGNCLALSSKTRIASAFLPLSRRV